MSQEHESLTDEQAAGSSPPEPPPDPVAETAPAAAAAADPVAAPAAESVIDEVPFGGQAASPAATFKEPPPTAGIGVDQKPSDLYLADLDRRWRESRNTAWLAALSVLHIENASDAARRRAKEIIAENMNRT